MRRLNLSFNKRLTNSALKKPGLRFVPSDYEEDRAGRHLLIWGRIPYWVVVDDDLFSFLERLDGARSVYELIAENPDWKRSKGLIISALRSLYSEGVVSKTGRVEVRHVFRPKSHLENVAVNVTNQCNLRCRFCYNAQQLTSAPVDELTGSEIISFLETLTPYLSDKPSLTLLGGEPLCCPEKTLELARYGRERGFQTMVSTNGTLLSPEFAREARKAGLQVQVSLDGATADDHERIRGAGTFEKVLSGIKMLVDHGAYVVLSLVCHQGNISKLEAYYRLAEELGGDEARFIPLKRIGGGTEFELQPPDMVELMMNAAELFEKNPELKRLSGRDAFSIMMTTCQYSFQRESCGAGKQTFLLDASGAIYPCLNMNREEFCVGNIRDSEFDFSSQWASSSILEKVRRETSVEEAISSCSGCFLKYWCLGGCHGETLNVKGLLDDCAWNCGHQKRAMLNTFWILSERPDIVRKSARFEFS